MFSQWNKIKEVLIVRGERGEDLLETIKGICIEKNVSSGFFTCIGTVEKYRLGFYDLEKRKYLEIRGEGGFEIGSCMGNISVDEEGGLVVHGHMVLSDRNGSCIGGHLLEGNEISGTAEIVIAKLEKGVKRKRDPETGLNLLSLR